MRVGFVQTWPRFGEPAQNLERVDELIGEQTADLWVLPELFSTGYTFLDRAECLALAEEIPAGPSTDGLVRLARRRNCHIVAGLAERAGEQAFNSAVVVAPAGHLLTYRKTHLYGTERECFAPGDTGFRVVDCGPAKLGVLVCFDWIYPESARTLALCGAEVLCHPANLVLPYCQAAMITRCLENRVFAVTANRIGEEERGGRRFSFTGRSRIISPLGEVLAEGPPDLEAAAYVSIAPQEARTKRVASGNDLFAERRPEYYAR